MPSMKQLKAKCARGKYASGGRVAAERKGAKTVINIIQPPTAPAPPAAPMPPAPPMGAPSPGAGPAVPPEAAAMALNQMQGKPGAPGAFKRGGRVKGGAEGGIGRLEKSTAARHNLSKVKVKGGR